jgi:lysophospholipase L1-like esterase
MCIVAGCAHADGRPREAVSTSSKGDASAEMPNAVEVTRAEESAPIEKEIEPAKVALVSPPPKGAPDVTAGYLEHPARLASLFARLRDVEAKRATNDVRIVQFGDSHTASDYGTSVVRKRLAARFGDGGRGLLPLGEPYKRLFQSGEAIARGPGFEPADASLFESRGRKDDGYFGLLGIAMETHKAGAMLQSNFSASADTFEINYLAQPGGGSFDVYIDGKHDARVSTKATKRESASHSVAVSRGPHSLEVLSVGDGALRVFGVRLDDRAVGVTFDSLGINGAKATGLLASNEAHFAEQVSREAPALTIIAYGTNESGDGTTPEEHENAIRTLALRVKSGEPSAECLVLGPVDRDVRTNAGAHTMSKLRDLIAAQRRAADEAGCAFYDQFAAMGGSDSIGRWASESPPRARRDLVHLTRSGYTVLADTLVRDLLTAYATWSTHDVVAVSAR